MRSPRAAGGVLCCGTTPLSTSKMVHASDTVLASGPTWSSDGESGNTPAVEMSPNEGFSPTTPHAAAGMRIDPPVSVPIDAQQRHAATDAAEPPLDPPGERARSCGLCAGP